MFNSPVVMGGPQNSPQARYQSHQQQQQQQQLAYQLPTGTVPAPHPANEHHLTQVVQLILFVVAH